MGSLESLSSMEQQIAPNKIDAADTHAFDEAPREVNAATVDRAPSVPEWNPSINIRFGGRGKSRASSADEHRGTDAPALRPRIDTINILLGAILLLALVLRMTGTDWDQGGLYHPDERDFLGRAERLDFSQLTEPGLLGVESRLNPRWFNYGSLPLYALAGLKSLASPFTDQDWNLFDLRFPGRNLAAIADTITVLFVFLLASRLVGDRRAGLIAALLAAMAVIHIQNAHYTAVDAPMTMFIIATIYFSTRLVQERRQKDALLAGVMLGLAIATKFSAAPVALALGTAHLLLLIGPSIVSRSAPNVTPSDVKFVLRYAVLSGSAAVDRIVGDATLHDYRLEHLFLERLSTVGDGAPDDRFGIYASVHRHSCIPLPDSAAIDLGIGHLVGYCRLVGTNLGVGSDGRQARPRVRCCLVVPDSVSGRQRAVRSEVFALHASGHAPVDCFYWRCHLVGLHLGHSQNSPRCPRRLVRVRSDRVPFPRPLHDRVSQRVHRATSSTGSVQIFEGECWHRHGGYTGTLGRRHTEYPGFYMHEKLPMYENDTSSKFTTVARRMEGADYFVLFSNRLAATIPRLPERYPVSSRFYEMLFSGELGYEVVYSSVRVPEFMGVVYWDDPYVRVPFDVPDGYGKPRGDVYNWDWFGWADESFTVYEHPHAIVFQNVEKLSQIRLLSRLYRDGRPDELNRVLTGGIGLVYDDAQAQTQQSGDSWKAIYFLEALPNQFAWLVWLVAVQLISLAAVPLTYVVFRPLSDRGYLFSKPLGLLIVATIAWLLASSGILGFSALSVGISVVLLAAISLAIFWRIREEIVVFAKAHIRTIAIAEAIFLVAFLAFFLIRLANPDLWHAWRGGEKPMDFAYLNAITRSTIMPPYDPWFAGGYLNYYYYGQFIIASLIRITGIVPTVAYNLAVPLIFALSAGAIYTVAYNLVAMSMRARGAIRLGNVPIMFGLIAAVLALVAANIDGLVQVATALYDSMIKGGDFPRFDYWRSTRIFEHGTGGNEITEFPFFTFLYADLHAHMIAIPFAVLALGLAIVAFLRAGMERLSRFETLVSLAILGMVVGSLRLINSWDYPTQLLLAAGFIFAGEFLYGHRGKLVGIAQAIGKIAVVGIVGYVVYLPFHANFELFNNGIEPSKFQTALWRYLAIHAFFVFAIGSWLLVEWQRGTFRFRSILEKIRTEFGYPNWAPSLITIAFLVVWLAVVVSYPNFITVVATLSGAAILGLTGLLAYLRRHPEQRYIIVTVGLVLMSLFIAAGVDLITVKNDIGRQNTIFKFYIQAWWLLAIAATFAVWRLWDVGAFVTKQMSGLKIVWLSTFGVLAVGVMIYPVMATDVRLDDRFNDIGPGVDGEAYMDSGVYTTRGVEIEFASDLPGIEWLRENVDGSPVVVEAQWDLYTWANRVSIYTGLPYGSRLGLAPDATTARLSVGGATSTERGQQLLHDTGNRRSTRIPGRIRRSVRLCR